MVPPPPLMLVDAIIRSTIVDVFNFQKFVFRTLGFMGNCNLFKILAIAKFWQCVLRDDKLNGHTKRKTEYFSFLKHPFQRHYVKCKTSNRSTMTITPHTVTAAATAAMTASKQQTGVTIRINE